MCILPEMFCSYCLMESFGQLLRYPVEEVMEGLRLCSKHKREYLINPQLLNRRSKREALESWRPRGNAAEPRLHGRERERTAPGMKMEIETPEGTVYSKIVDLAIFQRLEGKVKVLPSDAPMIAELEPGELIVHRDGQMDFLVLGEGLVLASSHMVAVVTDVALPVRTESAPVLAAIGQNVDAPKQI